MCKKENLTREKIHLIQIDEILIHKYLESEKAGRDLGEEAVKDWIEKYADNFRQYWENKLIEEKNE